MSRLAKDLLTCVVVSVVIYFGLIGFTELLSRVP
jgi:hypothetical protein